MFLLYDISQPLLRMDALEVVVRMATEAAFGRTRSSRRSEGSLARGDPVVGVGDGVVVVRGDDDDDDSDEEIKEDFLGEVTLTTTTTITTTTRAPTSGSTTAAAPPRAARAHPAPQGAAGRRSTCCSSFSPEFWWFEIADLARRILITCATLAFATSPKTFSESAVLWPMASSSKLLFFAPSVLSISTLQRGGTYISWSRTG